MKKKWQKYFKDAVLMGLTALLALGLGSQMPKWIHAWQGPVKKGDFALHVNDKPYGLTLYGTSTCPHCETARQYLRQAGVQFNDLILDKDVLARQDYQKLGEKAVPVLVSADRMMVGFEKEAYARLVATHRP